MDTLEYFNTIAEQDYKKSLAQSLEKSFRVLTTTYSSILKIYSIASKKLCQSAFADETQLKKGKNVSSFEKLQININQYAEDLKIMSQDLFDTIQIEFDQNKNQPPGLLGMIEDTIYERKFIIKQKIEMTSPWSNVGRQLHSIGTVISGLKEVEDNKASKQKDRKMKEDESKKIQVIRHLNGKIRYKGNVKNKTPEGQGISNHYNGNLEYRGDWVNGKMEAETGEVFHFNGNIKYQGPIHDGKFEGDGEEYHPNGCLLYKGEFYNNKPFGLHCELYWDNGNMRYNGPIPKVDSDSEDQAIEFEGYGSLFHKNGNLEYEGHFQNGGPQGESCTVFYENGQIKYKGRMRNGKYEGFGCSYDKNGRCEYKGIFKGGKQVDEEDLDDHDDSLMVSPNKDYKKWINYRQVGEADELFDYEEPPNGETYYTKKLNIDPNKNIITFEYNNYDQSEYSDPESRVPGQKRFTQNLVYQHNKKAPQKKKERVVKESIHETNKQKLFNSEQRGPRTESEEMELITAHIKPMTAKSMTKNLSKESGYELESESFFESNKIKKPTKDKVPKKGDKREKSVVKFSKTPDKPKKTPKGVDRDVTPKKSVSRKPQKADKTPRSKSPRPKGKASQDSPRVKSPEAKTPKNVKKTKSPDREEPKISKIAQTIKEKGKKAKKKVSAKPEIEEESPEKIKKVAKIVIEDAKSSSAEGDTFIEEPKKIQQTLEVNEEILIGSKKSIQMEMNRTQMAKELKADSEPTIEIPLVEEVQMTYNFIQDEEEEPPKPEPKMDVKVTKSKQISIHDQQVSKKVKEAILKMVPGDKVKTPNSTGYLVARKDQEQRKYEKEQKEKLGPIAVAPTGGHKDASIFTKSQRISFETMDLLNKLPVFNAHISRK